MKNPPAPEEIADWNRWFAVEFNNRACEIAEDPSRTPAETEELLHAAHAAAVHWSKTGTALTHARADTLLGLAYAILSHGSLAMHHARRSFDYLTSIASPGWEIALAHAVLAFAAFAARNPELHARHYTLAQSLGNSIVDELEKEIFLRTFRQLPVPGANPGAPPGSSAPP